MISFYPGPSQVEPKIPGYVKDAYKDGVLSMNHRSPEFEKMCRKTVSVLRQKLAIPKPYTILFTSSATECWEILAQSLVKDHSIHLYNGAFGEKWFSYAKKIKPGCVGIPFDREVLPELSSLRFNSGEMICLTQNETSNGTQLPNAFIKSIKDKNPRHLIAVDAVSSMAGITLSIAAADIWISSVQKCFGLPAGLGLMVLSPRAMAAVKTMDENLHYNSLAFMAGMMQRWQTPFTPNVLAIYLLMRTMTDRPPIRQVHRQTLIRLKEWEQFFEGSTRIRHLVGNAAVRSSTVLTMAADPQLIARMKSAAKKNGFLPGAGYGSLKETTFRIANFPALKDSDIKGLMSALRKFL